MHEALSRGLLLPAYDLWRRRRPWSAAALRAHREGLAFRRAAAGWSDERKADWTLTRLREVVRRAADVPFYRERFAAVGFDPRADFGFDDYARLPVLERAEVAAAGKGLVRPDVEPSVLRRDATGGSTGSPTVVWKDEQEVGWATSATEHFQSAIGLVPGAPVALLWGHHLDPNATSSRADRARRWMHNLRTFDCFRLSPEALSGYHEAFQRWRPVGIVAYAGALAALAEVVEGLSARERLRYPRAALVTGAEKLYAHQRTLVERVFGRPVHERYGSREIGLIAFQETAGDTDYTVDWARLLVEPEIAGADAGLLVTKLRTDAMPMLRYRIGDVARFDGDARPGHPALRLREVIGRDVDRLYLPDGRWVHALSIPHMMKDFAIREFQVHQAADLSVEVRVVPSPTFDADTADRITGAVRGVLATVPVRVRVVDAIERTASNKWRPVLSDARPPARRDPQETGR